eukprot:7953883-Alexandrium_andersonii.AAC.1
MLSCCRPYRDPTGGCLARASLSAHRRALRAARWPIGQGTLPGHGRESGRWVSPRLENSRSSSLRRHHDNHSLHAALSEHTRLPCVVTSRTRRIQVVLRLGKRARLV